jgi:hypothetical protein
MGHSGLDLRSAGRPARSRECKSLTMADQTVGFRFIGPVAHQAAGRGKRAIREDRQHRVTERQRAKLFLRTRNL